MPIVGLKPKDLIGIPWRVAFALQADGWYLRQDIIWHKPNPMPESVRDRCTKAHEYIFLLTKSNKYYYDVDSIKEQSVKTGTPGHLSSGKASGVVNQRSGAKHLRPSRPKGSFKGKTGGKAFRCVTETRNKRSVWTIATKPFPEAHFATFPPELIEPCILAGSRPWSIVLDPFCGAGTTGLVSLKNERDFIGIDLNAEYLAMAESRIINNAPLLYTKKINVDRNGELTCNRSNSKKSSRV
jgi:DNA modification methylase